MMIRKVTVVAFSLLMLPSLSQAQCADNTSLECKEAKAIIEAKQNDNTHADQNSPREFNGNDETNAATSTIATTEPAPSSRKNKRRSEHQFPRYETADPRDTVLSSEICRYSSATYTYTCR